MKGDFMRKIIGMNKKGKVQGMEESEDNNIERLNIYSNKSKRKKVLIIVISVLCIVTVAACVITKIITTPKVEIDYGTSDIYTQKDMDKAIKVIKRRIKSMKGFELHKVYYVDDKYCNSDSTLKWINDLAKIDGWTEEFTQVIYFRSDFHTSKKEKDVENTGYAVDDEEIGFGWYLARTDGGKWRIISGGY